MIWARKHWLFKLKWCYFFIPSLVLLQCSSEGKKCCGDSDFINIFCFPSCVKLSLQNLAFSITAWQFLSEVWKHCHIFFFFSNMLWKFKAASLMKKAVRFFFLLNTTQWDNWSSLMHNEEMAATLKISIQMQTHAQKITVLNWIYWIYVLFSFITREEGSYFSPMSSVQGRSKHIFVCLHITLWHSPSDPTLIWKDFI